MTVPRSIAVIGGGWAGLATAVELCAAGARVTLFESARHLGGRARSVAINGQALDNGQHILVGAYHETLRLMRLVGAEPEKLLRRLPLDLRHPVEGFHLRLPQLPAPLNLAIGLALARGCTLGEKVRAARFMQALQHGGFRLEADCSTAELLDQHDQRGALRRLMWEPLCLAALNTIPEKASAQIFANVLRNSLGGQRADTDLLLPATDLDQVFPNAASRFIESHGGTIRLASRIDAITPTRIVDGKQFDGIVLATAPQHAQPLLAKHAETAAIAQLLETYTYEPIGCAYLGYPPEITLPFPMLGLERRHAKHLGQWVFDRGLLGGAHGVMSFVLSANGPWDALDNATLCTTLHGELETALGHRLPEPSWHKVLRERRATFSCRPNLTRPATKTLLPGLWLAGDYVYADYPGTIEGAIRSGIAAARSILAN